MFVLVPGSDPRRRRSSLPSRLNSERGLSHDHEEFVAETSFSVPLFRFQRTYRYIIAIFSGRVNHLSSFPSIRHSSSLAS